MSHPAEDFHSSQLDSIVNVIGLTPSDPLDTFAEMWYQVFLWTLFSSLFIHIISASIAFLMLKRHKTGRFIPIAVVTMGIVSPLTGGIVTSAAVAGVYRAAGFQMAPFYALIWGLGQTVLAAIMSFTRILATL